MDVVDTEEFLSNFQRSYSAGNNLDVEIHVNNKIFKASKFMLRANSGVFKAMLSGNTIENETNSIIIDDGFTTDTFERLLCFLHTGRVGISEENDVAAMLFVAEYYDVTALKVCGLNSAEEVLF